MVMRALKLFVFSLLMLGLSSARAESMAADTPPEGVSDDTMIGPRPAPAPQSPGDNTEDEGIEIRAVAPKPRDPAQKVTAVEEVAAAVDLAIEKNLAAMNIAPEELCDDPTFIRRVTLDLTGQIPSMQETTEFVHLQERDRREKKINDHRAKKIFELLLQPEYADHWSTFWTTVLLGRTQNSFSAQPANRLRRWLYEHLKNNTPYDQVVEQLLTASGNLDTNNNYRTNKDPQRGYESPAIVYLGHHLQTHGLPETAGNVTRTFLGIRMGCAQCHDHPFDKWTQVDFWKLCAYLSNTTGSEYGLGDADTRTTFGTYAPPEPELKLPPTLPGYALSNFSDEPAPKPLTPPKRGAFSGPALAEPPKPARGAVYRKELAKWITDPQNSNFDREAVNRVWSAMLGHGFVDPVDDLREKNPPTHPEAMEILDADFNSSSRDLRRLIAVIACTRA